MKTQRLQIEPLKEEHAIHLFPIMLNSKIYDYVDEEPVPDEEKLKQRYHVLSKGSPEDSNETWLNWAVKLNDKGTYIGTLQATVYKEKCAEIAYMFSPAFWGQGYAMEATSKLCDFLFQTFGLSEIIVSVDTNNSASIRLIERLGFHHFETVSCTLKGKPAQEHHYRLQHNSYVALLCQ